MTQDEERKRASSLVAEINAVARHMVATATEWRAQRNISLAETRDLREFWVSVQSVINSIHSVDGTGANPAFRK